MQHACMAYRIPTRSVLGVTTPELLWRTLREEAGPVVNGDMLNEFCARRGIRRSYITYSLGMLAAVGLVDHPRRNLWCLWRFSDPFVREAARAVAAVMSLGKWCVPNGTWALALHGLVPLTTLSTSTILRYCTTTRAHMLTTQQRGFEPPGRHFSWIDHETVTTSSRAPHHLPWVVPLRVDLRDDPSMVQSDACRVPPMVLHIADRHDALFDLFDRVHLNGSIDVVLNTFEQAMTQIDTRMLIRDLRCAPLVVRRRMAWALDQTGYDRLDIERFIDVGRTRRHLTALDPRRESDGSSSYRWRIIDNRDAPLRPIRPRASRASQQT